MTFLNVQISYLTLRQPTVGNDTRPLPDNFTIRQIQNIPLSLYRHLYNNVGAPWLWYMRRDMPDNQLQKILANPQLSIYILYHHDQPAGYIELQHSPQKQRVAVCYFGLFPGYWNRGLGPTLLNYGLQQAWSFNPKLVTVNTCTLDHPHAIACYQKSGFKIRTKKTIRIADPKNSGLFTKEEIHQWHTTNHSTTHYPAFNYKQIPS